MAVVRGIKGTSIYFLCIHCGEETKDHHICESCTIRVGTIDGFLRERRENPVCPGCQGPNTVMGIATAYFPYCSPVCQEG